MGNKNCNSGGGKCKGSYFAANPQAGNVGAKWCADPGQKCKAEGGPATVYYGGALSWRKIRLNNGQSVTCSASGWKKESGQKCGCDPAPALQKWCFKVQEYDPKQEFCCKGRWQISSFSGDVDFRGDSQSAVKGMIRPVVVDSLGDKADIAKLLGFTVDSITDDIYGQVCRPCSLSSAHTGYFGLDTEPWPPATEMGTSSAIDMEMVLPLVLALLVVLNCMVLLYVCISKCTMKGKKQYQVVQFQSESDMENRAFAQSDVES